MKNLKRGGDKVNVGLIRTTSFVFLLQVFLRNRRKGEKRGGKTIFGRGLQSLLYNEFQIKKTRLYFKK